MAIKFSPSALDNFGDNSEIALYYEGKPLIYKGKPCAAHYLGS